MVGSSSPAASDSSSDCRCNAGYTGPNGGTCAACSSGTYKGVAGTASCSSCPSGESCVLRVTSCISPHTYSRCHMCQRLMVEGKGLCESVRGEGKGLCGGIARGCEMHQIRLRQSRVDVSTLRHSRLVFSSFQIGTERERERERERVCVCVCVEIRSDQMDGRVCERRMREPLER